MQLATSLLPAFAGDGKRDVASKRLYQKVPMRKRKKKMFCIMFLPLLFAAGGTAQPVPKGANAQDDKAAVETVLRLQQEAWNRHDLDAFMTGYWNSPELTFFSRGNQNHGWQGALDHYRATYSGPGREMGKLEFSNLRIEMLGADAAFVRGEFHLTMSDGKTPHGIFTLVFRKFQDGWKIVHDHTSAAE
jgi:ketosteroid isomerase-like protein